MSIINEGSSESLIIAQGKNDFQINSSEQKPKMEDDIFQLSNDEVSLSFRIEEQQKMKVVQQLHRQSNEDTLILNVVEPLQQENRKKRKEIFERNRRPQKSILNKIQANKGEDNLLNIFDSIFNTKARDSGPLCGAEVNCADSRGTSGPFLEAFSIRSRTPSNQKRQRVKIFGKKRQVQTFRGVLPPDILQDSIKSIQKSELTVLANKESAIQNKPVILQTQARLFGVQSPIKDKHDQSMNFFTMEKRISGIHYEQNDVSRDSLEINKILESQIFQDQPKKVAVQTEIKHVEKIERRTHSLEEQKVVQAIVQPKSESPDFSKKNNNKIHITQPLIPELGKSTARSGQKEISPISKAQNLSVLGQPIEESRYFVNEVSSLSSAPQLLNQNYYGNNGILLQNSTVNIHNNKFGEVSSLKFIDTGIKQGINTSILYQSQVVQVKQRIHLNNIYQQENRLPTFLRKIRHQISIYPNFYHLRNPNTAEDIERDYNILFELFRQAITLLSNMCQKVLDAKSKIQLYMEQLTNNLSLQFFLESGWENICHFEDYELIAPVQPIELRGWSYQKAKTALTNYQNIVNYYSTKGVKLDPTSQKGQKKYFQIRQKFWDICGNLKLISQDIFIQMRNCMFPKHYYEFFQYMRSGPLNRINDERLVKIKNLLNTFRYQKQRNDILLNSQIGVKIKKKLELELRFLVAI